MNNHEETLRQIQERLAPFLELNQTASVEFDDENFFVSHPWGDETLDLIITPENDSLIDALNHLLLPPLLSSIFHIDTSQFEFIFTVLSLKDPLWSRNFEFIYNGVTYPCWYGESSSRLIEIASAMHIKDVSPSDYRNLRIYKDYSRQGQLSTRFKQFFKDKKAISFYLGPIKIESTDQIIELARHINFYMYFFDRHSPQIIIHKPDESIELNEEELETNFPEKILASNIDTYMLDLWSGAQAVNGRLAFLYYYQMLEYAAFYFIEEQVKLRVKKILRRPDLLSSTDSCLTQVIDEIVDYRQTDETKLTTVVKRTVNPERVWGVIEHNKDFFAKTQIFDGGFTIEAFINDDWTADDFDKAWIPKLPDKLRQIRNALVHSRESRVGQVIAPTRANNKKLTPWVKLIEEISCQVAIYQNI